MRNCTLDDLRWLAARVERGSTTAFGTLLLDPPWKYRDEGRRGAAAHHYPCMELREIADLPVQELAAPRSHLHLWATNAFLGEAIALCRHWGFAYKGTFVWAKPSLGLGAYWRGAHELLVLGVRGRLTFSDHSLRSWLEAKREGHSRKPAVVRQLLERASPGPRLELFAREVVPGWVAWGNEIDATCFHERVAALGSGLAERRGRRGPRRIARRRRRAPGAPRPGGRRTGTTGSRSIGTAFHKEDGNGQR